MSDILRYLLENQAKMLQNLETLVKAESSSNRKDLVDRCGEIVQEFFFPASWGPW
ncbi:hypothetical protein GCM10010965_30080 [Caldalkalibacillus thermarum]|nr:hypothetical protein GCM10010965_30080 [Caldalkalibacillus thermarum]